MNRSAQLLIALILLMFFGSSVAVSRDSVLQVRASGCGGDFARIGTGFVWKSPDTVVTALHVVAGCSKISIHSEADRMRLTNVQVSRVLRGYDLALLSVVGNKQPPLRSKALRPGQVVIGYGYTMDVIRVIDHEYRITETSSTLADLLTSRIVSELRKIGIPNVDNKFYLVDRNILRPGQSGSPLLDKDGSVVAIANGGLENGIVGINWVVSADTLPKLLVSKDTIPSASISNSLNFAFRGDIASLDQYKLINDDKIQPQSSPILCGDTELVLTKQRSLQELAYTSDDLPGLFQIMGASANLLDGSDIFNIYQNLESGASVAVPASMVLVKKQDACVAGESNGAYLYVKLMLSSKFGSFIENSRIFESQILQRINAPGAWYLTPWTYPSPRMLSKDFIVMRKGIENLTPINIAPGYVVHARLIETLAVKGDTLLAVALVRDDLEAKALNEEDACMQKQDARSCQSVGKILKNVALFWAGSHLSTFPLY